ncbi:T9SS type A sorting domain-containing protein [candidate division KSB1 bacterium]|nr:T9SS type A sorting domain-containing protein [candidate division KSB1 bacterium]
MKKLLHRIYFLLGLILGMYNLLFSQINVQLPDLKVNRNDTISVPMTIGAQNGKEISACLIRLEFNPQIITAIGATHEGTVAEKWATPIVRLDSAGVFKLALYGVEPLKSAGTLVYLKFFTIGNYEDTTRLHFTQCTFNAGNPTDPVARTRDGFITIYSEPVKVVITTNIGKKTFIKVDEKSYPAPYTATWLKGTTHTIGVSSVQYSGTDTAYHFASWSDQGTINHKVDVFSDTSFTAFLDTKFQVKVNSPYGNTAGAGWYLAGSKAKISVDSVADATTTRRFHFSKWEGTGKGAYSGAENPATITVNSAITQTAIWSKQFLFQVKTSPVNITKISGAGWYNQGAVALTGKAPASISTNDGERTFKSWILDGKQVEGNPLSIKMDTTHTAVANYQNLFTVKILTNLAEKTIARVDGDTIQLPATLGWIPDIKHKIEVPEIVLEANGQRYFFKAWNDKGARAHSVVAKKDTTFTATYEQQFQLTVQSNPLNLVKIGGSGWYPAGSTINLGPVVESVTQNNKKFKFFFWNVNQEKRTEISPQTVLTERTVAIANYFKEFVFQGMLLANEIPIPNMKVKLTGGITDSSVTNNAGAFIFEDLKAGKYNIDVPVEGIVYDTSKAGFEITDQNIVDFKFSIQDIQAPEVNLIAPVGDVKLKPGEEVSIEWKIADNTLIDSVKLLFSKDGGMDWELIATPADSDTVLKWTLPQEESKTCLIRVEAKDIGGNVSYQQNAFEITGIDENPVQKIKSFQLYQNFPNPFNPETEIIFEIPAPEMVSLRIFNLNGQEITRLIQQHLPAGIHRWRWQAVNLPSGIYYCQLQAGEHVAIRQMVLLR